VFATFVMAMAGGFVQMTFAQEGAEAEGQIIQIGPDQNRDEQQGPRRPRVPRLEQPGFPEPRRPMSPYWIGLVAGPVGPELRHQVDLPEGIGLVVRQVVPESPADEAGLEVFDILVRANDVELRRMDDLVDLVRDEGEDQGQIAVELLRRGQPETVWITPTPRPADAVTGLPVPPVPPVPPLPENPWFGQFFHHFDRGPDGGFEGRHVGPGVIVGGQQMSFTQLPNGVSVKVEKQADQPTKITVEREGEKWEVVGDDTEALDQLPEDLRPFVEQMLRPGSRISIQGLDLGKLQERLPEIQAQLEEWAPAVGEAGMSLLERIEKMEQQMRQLHEQLHGAPPAEEPQPAVEPPPVPETDVEIDVDTNAVH
jgi:hypothetical protein